MLIDWPVRLSPLEHLGFVVLGLLVYVVLTRMTQQRRHPSTAVAWVIGIAAFPYVGLPLFLLFGTRKFVRPAPVPAVPPEALDGRPCPDWTLRLSAGFGWPMPQPTTSVVFDEDGTQAFSQVLRIIDSARRTLETSTYVLGDDEAGRRIAEALERAAARGVHTRLLIDAVGSLRTPESMLRKLRYGGVEVRQFMPLWHNSIRGRTNLRNHRKLLVADGAAMWSGGRNLAAEYFVDRPGMQAWLDLSFAIEGPLAQQARAQFEADWHTAQGHGPHHGGLATIAATSNNDPWTATADATAVQWIASGPDRAEDSLHAFLMAASYQARDRILAATPYFVPDDALLEAWCTAARCGVRVQLLIPDRSNHRMADIARARALRQLVAAGAEVYALGQMMHAKAIVIDRTIALCGSLNLDGRSLFLNYEAMAAFYGQDQIGWLARWIEGQIAHASRIQPGKPGLAGDLLEGVVRSVGFQL